MDGIKDWLFPSTQILTVIRFRPLSLEYFYRRGLNPWIDQESPLSAYCRAHGVDEARFLREIAELPAVDASTHWEEHPCYHLIDYLTEEHRAILYTDIPAIRYLLDMGFPEAEGTGSRFRTLAKSIGDFADRLRIHFRHEEEDIFPHILADDFRIATGRPAERPAPPWMGHASGRLLEQEGRLKSDLDAFMESAGLSGAESPSSKAYLSVSWLMKSLGAKLRSHTRLERDVLFPIASRAERLLSAHADYSFGS